MTAELFSSSLKDFISCAVELWRFSLEFRHDFVARAFLGGIDTGIIRVRRTYPK